MKHRIAVDYRISGLINIEADSLKEAIRRKNEVRINDKNIR